MRIATRVERLERQAGKPLGPVVVWYGDEPGPSAEERARIEAQNGLLIHVEYVAAPPREEY